MRMGYGWKRTDKDLREAGAERVYVDTKKERPERTSFFEDFRKHDEIVLLHYNDLGGTKPATDRLIERLQAKHGHPVKVHVSENSAQFTPRGHSKFVPQSAKKDAEMREIWLDPWRPEADKMSRIAAIHGRTVKRHSLYYRYGSVDNPKK